MVRSLAWPVFFPRINDSHCDRIHSSLTIVHCFDNGYVEKQAVAWKEYYAEYWLKQLQKSMDRCTGHHDITEILLKTALNTIQSICQELHAVLLLLCFFFFLFHTNPADLTTLTEADLKCSVLFSTAGPCPSKQECKIIAGVAACQ